MSRISDWDSGEADPLAIEPTLPVHAEVCKTISKWLNEAHLEEEHFAGEMIQPGLKVR